MKTAIGLLALLVCGIARANPFFAMDTGTKDAQHRTAEEQVALVKEIGFDGWGPTYESPDSLKQMQAALDARGLQMPALYVLLNLDAPAPFSQGLRSAIELLQGRNTLISLLVVSKKFKPGDPEGDATAVPLLREIADAAAAKGVRIALYPHDRFWVERVDQAARFARAVDRKNLGVTFNLCHWLRVDGKELEARLEDAKDYLFVVTINGADADGKGWKQLIQPLDAGTFDVGRLLKKLKEMGYTGPIGLQHYGIGGDARENLQRSMNGWRRLQTK